MTNNTYRTGTAQLNTEGVRLRDHERWFVARKDGRAVFFRTKDARDRYVRGLNSGLVVWGTKAIGQTGTSENINAEDYVYRDIKFDEPEPVNDYKRKYEDLARALAAEAHKRKWCRDWENFADANGIPKELRTPPKVKLRVTLEVEVEDTENPVMLKSRVRDALAPTLGRAIYDGKVERL